MLPGVNKDEKVHLPEDGQAIRIIDGHVSKVILRVIENGVYYPLISAYNTYIFPFQQACFMPVKKRILVVEDEMIVAHSICAGLERMNYIAVGPVGSAEDAVRVALEEKPDLILMDIHLGKQADGIEAANEILKEHIIPIVYVTAHADTHTIDRAKTTGPYGYIHKPFSENEIRSAIEMALYKHEKQLEVNRSERLLSTTLKNIGDAVIATDIDQVISYTNPVAGAFIGLDCEQLPGKKLQDVLRLVEEKDNKPIAWSGEVIMSRPDRWYLPDNCLLLGLSGEHIPVSGSLVGMYNEKGQPSGIVAVLHDERRERQHAEINRIRKKYESTTNEIRTRLIKDKPPDISAILGLMAETVDASKACLCLYPTVNGNSSGREKSRSGNGNKEKNQSAGNGQPENKVRYKNNTRARETGEVVGSNKGESYGWIDPESRLSALAELNNSQLCGDWWHGVAAGGERLLASDIDTLPEEAKAERDRLEKMGIASVALFPFRSSETGYIGAVSFFWAKSKEEFSEDEVHALSMMVELVAAYIVRAKAEELLRSSENRFRTLIQKGSDVITVMNQDGVFLYVSPSVSKVLGYTEKELEGKSAFEFVHEDDLDSIKKAFQKVLDREDEEIVAECRFLNKNGKWVHLESIGSNLTMDPSLGGVVINSRDISDRKRFQQDLIRAKESAEAMSRVKTALLANMSHEMRTPLTGILGFATILESELPESEARDMATRIHASGQRLMETIESVLDLVKLEADKVRVQLERTNIIDEVKRNVSLHMRPARHKDLALEVKSELDELFIDIDRQLFGRILYNLLSNAIKYTDEGSVEVIVSTERDLLDAWVLIDIKDTGIGISTDFLPRVFDEFQQESSGYSRKYEGTGLGLTISRKLARIIGGAISVKSKKGEGSTFTVRVPLISSTGPVRERPARDEQDLEGVRAQKQSKVLIVEDDFDSSEVARFYLGKKYDLVVVDSGEKALEEIKKDAFDIILLDISLGPGMDGVKTLKALRKNSNDKSVPVIALTAHALRGDADYYLSQGFSAYMSKPYKKEELLSVVDSYIYG